MALTNKQRRDRDIHDYVVARLNEKIHGKQKYTYQAVLAMAEQKFYLAPDTIADIVRDYVPPAENPAQLNLLDQLNQRNSPNPQP